MPKQGLHSPLYEEYLNRHKLDQPLVRHMQQCCFFVREPMLGGGKRVRLYRIQWKPHNYHPGHYRSSVYESVHNGWEHRQLWLCSGEPAEFHWDDYEPYILKLSQNEHLEILTDYDDLMLTAWELFVFTHDSWLARCGYAEMVFPCIDQSISLSNRLDVTEAVLGFFWQRHGDIMKLWTEEVLRYIKDYPKWIKGLMIKDE